MNGPYQRAMPILFKWKEIRFDYEVPSRALGHLLRFVRRRIPLSAARAPMNFVRLACVLCSTLALHLSHTPPNPHPDDNTPAPTPLERYFMLWIICTKYLSWAACAVNLLQSRDDLPLTLMIGTALSVCGAFLRLWCFRLLGRRFTFQLATHPVDAALVTTGPYAVVRHPSYVAGVLCFAGVCIALLRPCVPWVWTVIAIASPLPPLFARVRQEELLLRQEFGLKWDDYCLAVPRRVLPGIL